MELRHLTTFVSVARHLSFTRAARDLGYAQSSVTAQVKALETDLGVPLFARLGRRVVLTDAGRELLPHARQLLHRAEQAREAVRGVGTDPRTLRGTLRIAAPESLCAHLLPPVLSALKKHFPLLDVVFGPAGRTTLLGSLAEGTLDAGFLLEERIDAPMAVCEVLTEQRMLLVARPGHPLLDRAEVHTGDLAGETLLLIESGCAQRDLMDRELRQAGLGPPGMEFVSTEALKRCAQAGLGVAVLPEAAVADELGRGELAQLRWSVRPRLGVHFLRHKDRPHSTVLTALADLARAHWAPPPAHCGDDTPGPRTAPGQEAAGRPAEDRTA